MQIERNMTTPSGQLYLVIFNNMPWLCAHQIKVTYPLNGMFYVMGVQAMLV